MATTVISNGVDTGFFRPDLRSEDIRRQFGAGPDDLASAIPIAEKHEWIFASAGIHPHEARAATPSHFDRLAEAAQHPKVIAIGEIGLDYHYDHSPRDVQQTVFVKQLEIARHLELPIIIHCRDAWEDLSRLAEAHWKSAGLGGILHCFSGGLAEARRFVDWGFLISFAGTLTFKQAETLRATACELEAPHRLSGGSETSRRGSPRQLVCWLDSEV